MARIIGGLGSPHAPSIGGALDAGQAQTPGWKPLFDGYKVMSDWLAEKKPDVMIVVYNDHGTFFFFDNYPMFAMSVAAEHRIADEGFGKRDLPPLPGDSELAWHLAHSLVDDEFDLTLSQDMPLDHGVLTPVSCVWPHDTGWPGAIIPIHVNVFQFPLPSALRCYKLGQAIRRGVESYDRDLDVVVFGTGGLSHQLQGERFGFNAPNWDQEFLDLIEGDPAALTRLRHQDFIERGGSDSVESIMWLIMRGALSEKVDRVHRNYYLPMHTGFAQVIFEDTETPPDSSRAGKAA